MPIRVSVTRFSSPTARRVLRRPAAGVVAAALLAAGVVALPGAAPAEAVITNDFEPVFSVNTHGSIQVRGNVLMSCDAAVAACADTRNAIVAGNNGGFSMQYVDVDADPTTFNSSSSHVEIPDGAGVLFAQLTWSGQSTAAARDQVRLTGPDGLTTPITGGLDTLATGSAYQGSADVTSLVQAAGEGSYTVANVQSTTGTNQYAGWSLVVVLSDPDEPSRNLTVYRGFGSITGTDVEEFTVDGFLTPPSGPVRTEIGVVVYEGDRGLTGDQLSLEGRAVTDASNPAGDTFNSSATVAGTDLLQRNPAYRNQMGMDTDVIAVDDYLTNSDTSATLRLTTNGDVYYPGVVTFATELYDPTLLGNKSVQRIASDGTASSAAQVLVGDTLEYTVPVRNIGLDDAVGSVFHDSVPVGTEFVPGSLVVDGRPLTDASGDDEGEFVQDAFQGHVKVRVGAGADSSTGGAIPITPQGAADPHVVSFRVLVTEAIADQGLVNLATYSYRGRTTGAAQAAASNQVSSVVSPSGGGAGPLRARSYTRALTPTTADPSTSFPVLADATYSGLGTVSVLGATDGGGGSVTVQNGVFTYTPRADFAGRDAFTYTLTDGAGATSTGVVRIDVVNDAPEADDDTASTPAATAQSIDVLAGDTDANGDALSVRSFPATTTAGGTLSRLPDGRLLYTPAAGFRGTDSFDYVVEDVRGGSDTGRVTITVTNRAPSATGDAFTIQAGTASAALSVLGNDSDPDGDTLSAQLVTGPSQGTLTLNANGTGTWTPPNGYVGSTTFTYRASDGTASSSAATVTLTVNGAPAAGDRTASTDTGTPVDVELLGGVTDPNGDTPVVSAVTQPAHGGVVVDGDGTATYTPDTGWAGTDEFTYTVADGRGGSTTRTVTVTVRNANPVAADVTGSTPSGTAWVFDALAAASDPNIPGTAQELTLTAGTASDGGTVVVDADGDLVITPATAFKGTMTATYTVSDGAGGSDQGTVTLTVADGAPTAVADGPVDTATSTPVQVDVLVNDGDVNGDTLSLTGVLGQPVDSDGTVRGSVAVVSGKVEYTPPTGWVGTVTFTYEVTDGTTPVTGSAQVRVLNAAPVAADLTAATDTDTPVTVEVLGDASDANVPGSGQQLSVTAATADHGAGVVVDADGALVVTPATGYKGTITVTYTVSDGAGGTDEGTVVVTVRDAAPVVPAQPPASTPTGSPVLVDVLAGATDANGDPLTIGDLGQPVDSTGTPRGTVAVVDGQVQYTPPPGFAGTVTFTYEVSDGTTTVVRTATVTVANAAPVAVADTATTVTGRPVVVDVVANDTDPNVPGTDQRLVVVSVSADNGATATVDDQGRVVVTPAPGFTGTVTVTYTVADGAGGLATGTLTVEVSAAAGGAASGGAPAGGSTAGGSTAASALPRTGTAVGPLLVGGGLTLLLGVALVVGSRRRVVRAG